MYNTHIQTTLSIRGHIIFIEYEVTEEWAVCWWINLGAYDDSIPNDEALRLLETLLRTYEHDRIKNTLISEFEQRQYAQEQAEAAKLIEEDISF